RALRASRAPVHRGSDAGDGAAGPEKNSAPREPRRAAESRGAPIRLCVRAPLPPRARRVPDGAARGAPRTRGPRRALPSRARAVRGVPDTDGGIRVLTERVWGPPA